MTESLLSYREQFPIFGERIYLASMCIGPRPRQALVDIEEFLATRALHSRALDTWFARIAEVTGLVEQLLHAPAGSVALRDSATAGQAAVLASIEPGPRARRIVVSELDFHSALHLYSAQVRRGFEVEVVPSRDGIGVCPEDLVARIDARTAVVAVSLVSRYNALLDLAPVVARAREVGAPVFVDAYQALGVLPVDVRTLGADVVVGGAHKWLSGETGLAFLYVDPALADRLQPAYPGWFGHQDIAEFVHTKAFVDAFHPVPGARRFQQGTPGVLPIYASRAGLQLALEMGVERIRARNCELTERLLAGATARGLAIRTPRAASERAGGICIAVPQPEQVVKALAARGVDVDQRRGEVLRFAPHACNTFEECDRALEALEAVLAEMGASA